MNLYISNLSEQITEESLRAIFATHGKVNSYMINRSSSSGRSGFIEMPNEGEAFNAIVKLDGCILDGHRINVAGNDPAS